MAYRSPAELANPLVFWQTAADLILMAVGAGVVQARMWEMPLNPPLEEEREEGRDLDVPGPLERDFEHGLHA